MWTYSAYIAACCAITAFTHSHKHTHLSKGSPPDWITVETAAVINPLLSWGKLGNGVCRRCEGNWPHLSSFSMCYWKAYFLQHCIKYPDAWQPSWTHLVSHILEKENGKRHISDKTSNSFVTFIRFDRWVLYFKSRDMSPILGAQCIGS